jgi:DNA repair protein RecO (recombination protein O)
VLCPNCGERVPERRPISTQALKYVRHFQRSNYRDALRANIDPATNGEIEALMNYYLTHTLEQGLNTPSFIRRMKSEESSSEQTQGFD